ncbi:MAG: sensor histidine kinase, partial [Thermoanaerobaculia bacterium]|nr:sensor histidine kinase [Thermoanaerobaculia bacterium]
SEEHDQMKAEIDDLIANALGRVRAISHELLPPTLEDFGLIEALKELCDHIRKTGALDVQLETELERADIGDTATELHLFRIVQELCNRPTG